MDVLGTAISIGCSTRRSRSSSTSSRTAASSRPVFYRTQDASDCQEHCRLHFPLAGHGVHPRLPRSHSPSARRELSGVARPPRPYRATATAWRPSPTWNTPRPPGAGAYQLSLASSPPRRAKRLAQGLGEQDRQACPLPSDAPPRAQLRCPDRNRCGTALASTAATVWGAQTFHSNDLKLQKYLRFGRRRRDPRAPWCSRITRSE